MRQFMQYFISGLSTGSIYPLVALGLALIYRSTRILNFAHGDMAAMGTFVAFTLLGLTLAPIISFPLAILSGCVLAMLFYFVILVPTQRRNATILGQIILTLGLGLILQGLISYLWGTDTKTLAWGLAASLGVLAGVFLAPALLLDPFFMLEPFLKGFAAAILGGLQSLPGAIVGGLILGVAESLAGGYISIALKNTLALVPVRRGGSRRS